MATQFTRGLNSVHSGAQACGGKGPSAKAGEWEKLQQLPLLFLLEHAGSPPWGYNKYHCGPAPRDPDFTGLFFETNKTKHTALPQGGQVVY